MMVLGIESTCDETACAIVKDGVTILSNVVSSQIDLHSTYGGVVPELACRRHVDIMIPVIEQALQQANLKLSELDLIAVANGPGLIGALLIGLNTAKALSLALAKPFVGVNHIEAHLYAALMSSTVPPEYPCLGIVLSGGHTSLIKITEFGDKQVLGHTVDDAVGEAFDKVGKLLGLSYPAGSHIESLAKEGKVNEKLFSAGRVKGRPLDFSFSGLKTGVLYHIKGRELSTSEKADIAASFQFTAINDIVGKALLAAHQHGCRSLIFGGGVTNNQALRKVFSESSTLPQLWPAQGLSLDNAAMIAGLGFHLYKQRGTGDSFDLEPFTRST
jgi:N6-L-threonylcarbamoyladenine synthase